MDLRKTIILVVCLNLFYFVIEFAVALHIGSVSLFADSVDFLEDASINGLIVVALGWKPIHRAYLGRVLACFLLIPSIATLWTAWEKFLSPLPPVPLTLSLTGGGALIVNFSCTLMLANFRNHSGSLTRAAFLSARNDVLANIAIIIAGLATGYTHSALPDLIVGLGIMVMNAGAAREVWEAAREEHYTANFKSISH